MTRWEKGKTQGYFIERLILYKGANWKSMKVALFPYLGLALKEDSEEKFSLWTELEQFY